MSHPFGDLISQHLHRKHGLSQSKLAAGILQEPSIITKMCKGQRLTGPQARERVVAIIGWLHTQGALDTLTEANALLDAAGMSALRESTPAEAALLKQLPAVPATQVIYPSASAPLSNLPTPLTTFIGRANEIAELAARIKASRLITLTGSGGVGKTRLAIAIGTRSINEFPDGVWLVDFAPVHDPALVARAICATLDLPERPERTDVQMALTFLKRKRVLLILDNCEHLIGACADFTVQVVSMCPAVSVLATSREPLHILGETTWRVESLTTPDPTLQLSATDLQTYEATQLFIERTRDAQPSFKVMPNQTGAIVEVCHRLDGIPLALEMAAAQMGFMTIEEIVGRLNDRFGMLMNGARTVLPRHRTLRAVQEWSYDLLSSAEQRLLALLSTFTGGWTSEAAKAVHGEENTLMLLRQLVHKSLVVAEPRDGRTRYRLLETVRQFAAEMLETMGQSEEIRRRHCDYFTALVEAFEPSMIGPRLKSWCDRVSADWSNIRAAVDWARPQADGGIRLARIAGSLWQYWIKRGNGSEITAWLQEAVARTSAEDGLPRARALIALAGTHYAWLFTDRPAERAMVEESLRLSRVTEDATTIAYALMLSGGFRDMRAGTGEDHLAPVEQSLRMFRQAGQLLGVGDALQNLALTYKNLGDEKNATKILEESARWCYETGETLNMWNSLNYLATFDASQAIKLGELMLAKHRANGDAEEIAATLQVLGRLHFKNGNYAEARQILEDCYTRWLALGRLWSIEGGTARCLWDLGPVLGFLGEAERGAAVLSQARDDYEQAGDEHGVAWAVYFRGQVLLMNKDIEGAVREMRKCLQLFLAQTEADGIALILCKLGEIAVVQGNSQQALRLIGSAMNREPNPHVHDMPPPWREAHQRTISWGRMHEEDSALKEGQGMALDQAAAYALSDSKSSSHSILRPLAREVKIGSG